MNIVLTPHTLLKVQNVNKQFLLETETVDVLKNVNFEVKEGSFTILHGPSGSGKSTMLNIILGLEAPTSGSVEMLNQNIYQLTADERAHFRQLTLGIVYQSNAWISSLNVLENVAFPLYLAGYDVKTAQAVAELSLKQVGLEEYHKQNPTKLSGGQQQRISMARALVTNPQIIVADEPTGNLDSKSGQLIMDLLRKSVEMGKTVILVTHNLEYLPYSTQQLEIRDGVIVDSASPSPRKAT